ncbi:MAG: hypothetical protein ACOCXP_04285 [Candidatus Dojkabacteria bacterium]
MALTITKKNALFQEFDSLTRNRTKRLQKGQFLVSGVRMIDLAIANDWRVDYVLIDMAADLSAWAEGIIQQLKNQTI